MRMVVANLLLVVATIQFAGCGADAQPTNSAVAVAGHLTRLWMLKAISKAPTFLDDDLVARTVAKQDGSPQQCLAWYLTRNFGTIAESTSLTDFRTKLIKARGSNSEWRESRYALWDSLAKLGNDRTFFDAQQDFELQTARSAAAVASAKLAGTFDQASPISIDFAKSIIEVERRFAEALTPALAQQIAEAEAAMAMSVEVQSTYSAAELLLHQSMTPERAASVVRSAQVLQSAEPGALPGFESKIQKVFSQVLREKMGIMDSFQKQRALMKEVEPTGLLEARRRVLSLLRDAK